MKYGFIYITTNLLNNKKYIGMKKYSKGWESYMGSSKILLEDIKKYGIDNFKREIIEECENRQTLQEREIYHLKENNVLNDNIFYNQSIPHKDFRIKGKTNSSKGKTWEDIYGIEGAKNRRDNSKLKNKTWEQIYGLEETERKRKKAKEKRSIKTRIKMSKSRMGIKFSEETRRKISESVKKYYQLKNNQ
jgi:hypothetical protein